MKTKSTKPKTSFGASTVSSDSEDDKSYSSVDSKDSLEEDLEENLSEDMQKAKSSAVVVSTSVMYLKAPWKTFGITGRFWPQRIDGMIGNSETNGVTRRWKANAVRFCFLCSNANDLFFGFGKKYIACIEEKGKAIYFLYPIVPGDILKDSLPLFMAESMAAAAEAEEDDEEVNGFNFQ